MESGGWFTHFPVLAAALAAETQGPVLELGSGNWSTVMLHMICGAQNRELVTLETDGHWLSRFEHLRRPWHRLQHVPNWDQASVIDNNRWGVAFVDHNPWQRRGREIERLRNIANLIVVHDSQHIPMGCEPIFRSFRYRSDFRLAQPNTTVVSEFRPTGMDVVQDLPEPPNPLPLVTAAAAAGIVALGWRMLR